MRITNSNGNNFKTNDVNFKRNKFIFIIIHIYEYYMNGGPFFETK